MRIVSAGASARARMSALVPDTLSRIRSASACGSRTRGSGAGQQFWALLDQGCVSAGNFLTTVLLARTFAPTDYGIYVLLYGLILTTNNIHSALICYGMSLQAAVCSEIDLGNLVCDALTVTAWLGLLLGATLAVIAAMMCSPVIAVLILLTMLFGQFQETIRRALMARMRYRDAILGDAVSYLGQAAALALLMLRRSPGLTGAFAVFVLSSGAAAFVQALQLRLPVFTFRRRPRLIPRLWQVGRWALVANLVHNGGTQLLLWLLALFGTDKVASFQATMNVLNTTNPVMYSVGNVVFPAVASNQEYDAFGKTVHHAIHGAAFIVTFMCVVIIAPQLVLECFYGPRSEYLALGRELRFLMVASPIAYLAYVLGSFYYGLGRGDVVLLGNCAAAVAILVAGFYLCSRYGALGAVGAYDLSILGRSAIFVRYVRGVVPEKCGELDGHFGG